MSDSRFTKLVIQIVLGGGLILGTIFLVKTQSGKLSNMKITVQPNGTVEYYQRRMRSTEQMLGDVRSDHVYGRQPTTVGKSRRSKSS